MINDADLGELIMATFGSYIPLVTTGVIALTLVVVILLLFFRLLPKALDV